MAALATPELPDAVGHFELRRVLGRGTQSQVWLAHDARSNRAVALKLLDRSSDAADVHHWLHESRAISRLSHPHIVPVLEADIHEGQPFVAFELVDGQNLAQARAGKQGMSAKEAVMLMLGVLDALVAAHEIGVLHRDLKPSAILLGRDSRPRMMDFGIATRLARRPGLALMDPRVVGTPGYLSPEAARGAAPSEAMDVFGAAAVLGELLAGAPLLQDSDPYRAVDRVQREDLLLPPQVRVDPALRSIVHRALSRDLKERYGTARALQLALTEWLNPDAAELPGAGSSPAALEALLRRMRIDSDFPALSSTVIRIQRVAASETESLQALSREIKQDLGLTHKLLRMVNTAHFSAASGGGIQTIARAVAVVGFAGIRKLALSAVLLEHMKDKAHAAQLKEEFLRALSAATLADELAPQDREAEEAFLGAMFQNLGRLMTECYLPDEALQIRQAIRGQEHTPQGAQARESAARRVLGVTLDELGGGVARAWNLPLLLRKAMHAPASEVPADTLPQGLERLRWLGRAVNAMADAMLAHDGDEQIAALNAVGELYGPALGVSASHMLQSAQRARGVIYQLAQAMDVQVPVTADAWRLLQATRSTPGQKALEPVASASPLAGLQDTLEAVRSAVAEPNMRVSEVLRRVLLAMHQSIDFRAVVLCLRDPKSGLLTGRLGLGQAATEISAAFRVAPDPTATDDLFAWLCARGIDLLVSDASTVSERLPAWYRKQVDAPTFLLLPLMRAGEPLGLIYADKTTAGSIQLDKGVMAALQALRDQAVKAFSKSP